MPRLSTEDRWQAIGMLRAGVAIREVAWHFQCHHSTIVRLNRRNADTGTVNDRPRMGQPRVTTAAQDQHIVLTHLHNRFQTSVQTSATVRGTRGYVSAITIRRRLREAGLRSRRPLIGHVITERHRTERLAWAETNIRRLREEWRSRLFSDESRFNLSHADRRIRVWRRNNERYADACIVQHNRYGGGSVHVWGGFSYHHRSPLHVFRQNVNANVYLEQVLDQIVVPLFNTHNELHFFQQDNARPHTANITRDYLAQQHFHVLEWPANSPDMNPIEHA